VQNETTPQQAAPPGGGTGQEEPWLAALEKVQADGNTALIDGSYAGMMIGESDVGRSLLIVFSDGLDTSSWLSAGSVLETARRSDVVVYGVSAGGGTHPEFLRDLCATTGGTLFDISSMRDLGAIFVRVLEEFRQRYLVSCSPRGVSQDGWHRIDVRVRDRNAIVKARPGYQAPGS
jgi:VWFA-related protein